MTAQRAHAIQPSNTPTRQRRAKPSILFVDDEQRVLNSMRALFRRDYDVHVTTLGSEALTILRDKTVEVIVADQRMPEMTGVEVLGAAKDISPNTVRILLTGYADLDAIEGSINIGEVFRFLSKPCPPNHLRETIKLAVDIAAKAKIPAAASAAPKVVSVQPVAAEPAAAASQTKQAAPASDDIEIAFDETIADDRPDPNLGEEIIMETPPEFDHGDTIARDESDPEETANDELSLVAEPVKETSAPIDTSTPGRLTEGSHDADNATEIVLSGDEQSGANCDSFGGLNAEMGEIGVVVFSSSESFAQSAVAMLAAEHTVVHAKTLVQVTEILAKGEAGVLVTDFVSEGRVLRKMIATLKRYLPELITIVISDDRDASEMISLINHGQVFRYMSKPAQRDRFTQNVNAAVLKHIQLRDNPELVQRHQVENDGSEGSMSPVFANLLGKIKSVRKLLVRR